MKVGFSVLIFLSFFVGLSQGSSKWQLPPQNEEQLMTVDDHKNVLASSEISDKNSVKVLLKGKLNHG